MHPHEIRKVFIEAGGNANWDYLIFDHNIHQVAEAKQIAKKIPHIRTLLSYQDEDVHVGTIYKASGWTPVKKTKGHSWSCKSRKRNKEQSLSNKVRWEYAL